MKAKTRKKRTVLNASYIQRGVLKRLVKYEDLNLLERFAMFMAMAQLLELKLKRLLAERYEYDFGDMKRWTLGTVSKELEKNGLRADFILLLKSVVQHRNHIAHELLANEIMLGALLNGRTGRLERRQLEKGIYELEQLIFLHDMTEKHKAWGRTVKMQSNSNQTESDDAPTPADSTQSQIKSQAFRV